jgi:hypothetical protein
MSTSLTVIEEKDIMVKIERDQIGAHITIPGDQLRILFDENPEASAVISFIKDFKHYTGMYDRNWYDKQNKKVEIDSESDKDEVLLILTAIKRVQD